ncbi:diguanylate cyclase domain-containing protein [Geomesophilobacter sediminis]|uniref:Diguanylate cyclase n=1 Tax=Geomesophilobacter sediminis TaxID=2798584 RepID=A0A8J7LZ88_9BACT|nr:diguanylate cyclase [Geomesophilobacter sediminis]MBJ6726352.1 diguanylate cyclase [Geomesophilobacter sediminis]
MAENKELLARNRQLEKELQELKRRESLFRKLASAVEHSPISVMITDRNGNIEYVNPKFCEVTGYTQKEVLGKNPRFLKGEEKPELYRQLWETILSGREWHGELRNRNKNGGYVWELASISPLKDETGFITHFVGVKEDITELKRLQAELGLMAHSDELTGLPNRALFLDRLEQVINRAKRHRNRFALLYLDLDGFKSVNDQYGHRAGDEVLKAVADRLMASVRRSDTLARIGGDEFTVIIDDLKHWDEPGHVARNLLEAFNTPIQIDRIVVQIGVSIGISVFPDDGEDGQTLISSADTAMYEIKRGGKSNYTYTRKSV